MARDLCVRNVKSLHQCTHDFNFEHKQNVVILLNVELTLAYSVHYLAESVNISKYLNFATGNEVTLYSIQLWALGRLRMPVRAMKQF